MNASFPRRILLLVAGAVLAAAWFAFAQPAADSSLTSPRQTMRVFLEAFAAEDGRPNLDAAAACLDLGDLPFPVRARQGRNLANELKHVIDRLELVDFDSIPDDGGLEQWVFSDELSAPIVLAPDSEGRWLFNRATVAAITALFHEVRDRTVVEGVEEAPVTATIWLRDRVPESFRHGGFILYPWQWLALPILLLFGLLIDRLVVWTFFGLLAKPLSSRYENLDLPGARRILRPTGLLGMAAAWWLGIQWLGLPPQVDAWLDTTLLVLLLLALGRAAFAQIDLLGMALRARARRSENRFQDQLVPFVTKTLKLAAGILGAVFLIARLGGDVTALLAGLGLSGLAVALAAQDLLKNLFGSITVLLDRPFRVGDWIRIGDVEGVVEDVGFRSTRVRTFHASLITLPNARLIDVSVDNYGARRFRRWSTRIRITYDTPPATVDAFCEGIRQLVRDNASMRQDAFEIHLNEFGAHALEIMLYVFFVAPDWSTELRLRHDLALDILRLADRLGVRIAFPTRTIQLEPPPEPPPGDSPQG